MSDVNINQPLQLIRFKEGKFQVPSETAQFLKGFTNPLAVISIVGKYRTGKSLFLNKVLLKNSTFKVSPTINSCTKGLWMCRQTLKSEQPGQEVDVLVLDSEGFGAPEETDKYNNKILLFAMLLSSFFIYNSVGSIDQNSLNSLNIVSQLAREIFKNNSKDQKIEDQSPAFLWLLRDFSLNLVDKSGLPIQARQYLQQSLEVQKGSSDSIQNKNKIRRMLRHFFKDRDCFTLVRPVQSEQDLQNLLKLPDVCLRPQFLDQASLLRHKIMKKIRSKKIKGKPLDGQMLLQLVNNYVDVVNKGDLPNFELSYKHMMRFQIQRTFSQFMSSCQAKVGSERVKLLSKKEMENMQKQLIIDLQTKFKGDSWDVQEVRNTIEKGKKEIDKMMSSLRCQNYKKCVQNCQEIWHKIYQTQRQFIDVKDIQNHFEVMLQNFNQEMKSQSNPIQESYLSSMVYKEQIKVFSNFVNNQKQQSNNVLTKRESVISKLQEQNHQQKSKIKQIQESNHQLNRQLNRKNAKIVELEETKNMEIGYLKEKETNNTQEIDELMKRYQEASENMEHYRNTLIDQQARNQQLSKDFGQTGQDNRLLQKQLDILRVNLTSKSQEVVNLRGELAETSSKLQASLEKQSFILSKHQSEIQHKNQDQNILSKQSEKQLKEITKFKLRVQELQKDLETNTIIMEREKNIYESMFESLKESLKLEGNSRQELIETNKNLSAALKHLEKRAEQAEEKQKQLKEYKKCIKNSSCLQCQHCNKFFVPSIFLPHLNVCLIGPEALKTTKPTIKNSKPKLDIKVRQTLVRQSVEGKTFTQYVIEFKRQHKEWTVTRKYKSFCDFHSTLKGALPGVQLSDSSYVVNPQEASKKSLVIEQRRKALERYLNDLEANPFVAVTPMWAQFIQQPESESVSSSLRSSPLKQNMRLINQEQTPEQFFKVWNQRQKRGKQSESIKGKWKM